MKTSWDSRRWAQIKKARPDLTDYLIHWTKERYEKGSRASAFEVVVEIVRCGYLKPGFAVMTPLLRNPKPRPTVRGSYPAACFTEQTLGCFLESCKLSSRYRPYGVALHKWALYHYGGRPVIYGSEDMLGRKLTLNERGYQEGKEIYTGGLPVDYQYLWVRYDPVPGQEGYPVDFTHEREWRCRPQTSYHAGIEGVPILLPPVISGNKVVHYYPRLLVRTIGEKNELARIIREELPSWKEMSDNRYLKDYYEKLPRVKIVALEEVEEHLQAGDKTWARLEDIPDDA